MANYDSLINAVKAAVKTNGTGAITGATLQATLLGTIEELTVGFQFMGVATPETTPDSNDKKEFYLGFAGTYANFGSSVTVPEGSVILSKKNNGAWSSQVVKIVDPVSVSPNPETGGVTLSVGNEDYNLAGPEQAINLEILNEANSKSTLSYAQIFGASEATLATSNLTSNNKQLINPVSSWEWVNFTGTTKHSKINHIYDKIEISAVNGNTWYFFAKEELPDEELLDTTPYLIDNFSRPVVESGQHVLIDIPEDAEYIYFLDEYNGVVRTPQIVFTIRIDVPLTYVKEIALRTDKILNNHFYFNKSITYLLPSGYIDAAGGIVSSQLSEVSQPISLDAGDTIIVRPSLGNDVTIIGQTNEDSITINSVFVPLVISHDNLMEYTYTAKEPIKVVVCGRIGSVEVRFENPSKSAGQSKRLDFIDGAINRTEQDIDVVRIESGVLSISGNTINGLPMDKTPVACKIIYEGKRYSFEENGQLAYQGSSSLSDVRVLKKGFTLTFEKKHRFGNWLEFDEFHLKGYYSDWIHFRDLCSNRILEQMYQARPIAHRRPYMLYNDFDTDDYRKVTDVNAMCHIDGYPVELYINGVYWGLYSLNIKKARDNYMLSKNDVKHIQIEAAKWHSWANLEFAEEGAGWENIEIRNPKSDSGNTSFEDGVEPNAGEVKTAWVTFIQRMNAITNATTVQDLEDILNIEEFVDAFIQSNFIGNRDIWGHNFLYTMWDGVHWSPCLYDMDGSLGMIGILGEETALPTYDNLAYASNYVSWVYKLETVLLNLIKTRYAELRRKGVLNAENVGKLLDDWTKEVGKSVYDRDLARWNYPSIGIDSPVRIQEWIADRIAYLDTRYDYSE